MFFIILVFLLLAFLHFLSVFFFFSLLSYVLHHASHSSSCFPHIHHLTSSQCHHLLNSLPFSFTCFFLLVICCSLLLLILFLISCLYIFMISSLHHLNFLHPQYLHFTAVHQILAASPSYCPTHFYLLYSPFQNWLHLSAPVHPSWSSALTFLYTLPTVLPIAKYNLYIPTPIV